MKPPASLAPLHDPEDGRSVARWACARVVGRRDTHGLWVRYVKGGFSWWLTEPPDRAPTGGGGWVHAADIDTDTAYRVDSRESNGWSALVDLACKIEAALKYALTGRKPPEESSTP